ncbi:MAG: NUDIX domain-containing protein, partial [Planctomycetia bacterium]
LMDLGALVCTPKRPLCTRCPLEKYCVAARDGLTETIPVRRRRQAVQRLRETVVVVRRGRRVLVERRGPGRWWEGLWDFPRAEGGKRGRTAMPLVAGLECGPATTLGTLVYTVTHHRVSARVVTCSADRPGRGGGRRWVSVAELSRLAMPAPARRIAGWIAAATGAGGKGR